MLINSLPSRIAVFPLSNAVFFPKTILPLNIFEKRYIKLVDVYEVGCLGKIISFNETSDGRYIINLSGLIRFRIEEELNNRKLYREFKVDYSDFFDDLNSQKNESYNYDLEKLLNKIETYFKRKNYLVQFDELKKLNFDQLVNTVCMISSFSAEEKQKIIETVKIEDKLKIFEEVINFNLLDNTKSKTIQ